MSHQQEMIQSGLNTQYYSTQYYMAVSHTWASQQSRNIQYT